MKEVVRSSHPQASFYDTKTLKKEEINGLYQYAIKNRWISKFRFFLEFRNIVDFIFPKFRSIEDVRYFFKLVYVTFFYTTIERWSRRFRS